MDVAKYGHTMELSDEAVAESRESATTMNRWLAATPQERAQWAAEARRKRAEERAQWVAPLPLTMDALLTKMRWSRQYAEHLVQSYCDCSSGSDGWDFCQHAYDLGLAE